MSRWARALAVGFAIVCVACAEPPSREIQQAHDAIAEARAAGAEQHAASELNAAVESLNRADKAVADGDYRLALVQAVDSRDRAQQAITATSDARARLRANVERKLGNLASLIAAGRKRLAEPATTRAQKRTVEKFRAAIDDGDKSMQEARTALATGDYAGSTRLIDEAIKRIQAESTSLDEELQPPASKRRRER
jgi:hypothetical protein